MMRKVHTDGAGIIPFTVYKGRIVLLLTSSYTRRGKFVLEDAGGKTESDEDVSTTAWREFRSEMGEFATYTRMNFYVKDLFTRIGLKKSGCDMRVWTTLLLPVTCEDIVTGVRQVYVDNDNPSGNKIRVHIVPIDSINSAEFNDYEGRRCVLNYRIRDILINESTVHAIRKRCVGLPASLGGDLSARVRSGTDLPVRTTVVTC
jgi:hypothetical protein